MQAANNPLDLEGDALGRFVKDAAFEAVVATLYRHSTSLTQQFRDASSLMAFLRAKSAGTAPESPADWEKTTARVTDGVRFLHSADWDAEISRLWRANVRLPGGQFVKEEFSSESLFRAWSANDPEARELLRCARA